MNKFLTKLKREIKEQFRINPFMLVWYLLWVIPLYTSLLLTATMIAITNLSIESGVDFLKEVL
jgi:hypothetical protein